MAMTFIPENPPFELTDGEKAHPLWLRIKEYLNIELVSCRAGNDNPKLDQFQTATLRGQIACLKKLIALDEQLPTIVDGE